MTKAQKQEREDAVARLRGIIGTADTVHMYVASVSRSGMSRVIVPMVFETERDGGPWRIRVRHIGRLVCRALGLRGDDDQGVRLEGGGMDMGFHLVEMLGRALGRQLERVWI